MEEVQINHLYWMHGQQKELSLVLVGRRKGKIACFWIRGFTPAIYSALVIVFVARNFDFDSEQYVPCHGESVKMREVMCDPCV